MGKILNIFIIKLQKRMKRVIKFILVLILLEFTLDCNAQKFTNEGCIETVRGFVDAYNAQDFGKMRKPFFFIGRLIISKKQLKKEFGKYYSEYGRATIDTITHSSRRYTAKLRMEKDKYQRTFLSFFFSDKGEIMGLGFGQPTMYYPKVQKADLKLNQTEISGKIDSLMNKKYIKAAPSDFNGCIMVLDGSQQLYKKSFGYADYQTKARLNDSSVFELASCSKQFTAMAIMMLSEQGKLNLSDSVQKFIPDLPYHGITIENLLTHTSGLPDYEDLLDKKWDKSKFATNADIVSSFVKYKPKPEFLPGERFSYSNTGYTMLSLIIEKASGKSYREYLDKYIFKPLKMNHTRVYNTRRWKNEKIENYAYGYVWSYKLKRYILPDSVKDYKMVIYQDPITGDGTVNSTTVDLVKWEDALSSNTLIKKELLEQAWTGHKTNNGKETHYGFGFFVDGGNGTERIVDHTGGWPGYTCMILHFRDLDKTIIVLTNNDSRDIIKVTDSIAALLLGQ
jgi:CubicO group peptidase (beta-lactamase class C family)